MEQEILTTSTKEIKIYNLTTLDEELRRGLSKGDIIYIGEIPISRYVFLMEIPKINMFQIERLIVSLGKKEGGNLGKFVHRVGTWNLQIERICEPTPEEIRKYGGLL